MILLSTKEYLFSGGGGGGGGGGDGDGGGGGGGKHAQFVTMLEEVRTWIYHHAATGTSQEIAHRPVGWSQ